MHTLVSCTSTRTPYSNSSRGVPVIRNGSVTIPTTRRQSDRDSRRLRREEAETLSGHTGDVRCVAPLKDGRIVSGSQDKTLIVWAAGADGAFAVAETLSGHDGAVTCVAQLDDRRLVSGSFDKTLIVWEADDDGAFAAAQILSGHSHFVTCVALLDDGRLVSGGDDKTLVVWEE